MMELGELSELIVDCEHKTAPTQEVGYPSIRTPNIGRGYFILDGVNRVSEETYKLWTKRAEPQSGDIIMAREAPVGNAALIPDGLKPCLGQRTLLIRPNRSKVFPAFLNYLLNGPEIQGAIHAKTNGATVAHLNMKDVRSLPIPELPPIYIQRRIAGILSAYDELIENNQRRIRILEEMARSLYREWFVHFRYPGHESAPLVDSPLGQIPQGWEVKKLGDLINYKRRSTKPGQQLDERRYVPIDCLPSKSLALLEAKPIEEAQSSLQLFEKGDILFGAMRPYFHKVVVAPFAGVTRTTCFVFKPMQPGWHAFATMTVFDETTVAYANAHSQGATIPYAVWDGSLSEMPLVLPSTEVLQRFETVVAPMLSQLAQSFFALGNLRRTRDLLLPRLLSGAINIQAINQEEAHV
ncbi:restriction endonuclease subunit S [Sideroxyarcus sp. TK5]